jgi:hypothetical protein
MYCILFRIDAHLKGKEGLEVCGVKTGEREESEAGQLYGKMK